ncbi:hypothetical protein FF1_011468 [Malus domestica]
MSRKRKYLESTFPAHAWRKVLLHCSLRTNLFVIGQQDTSIFLAEKVGRNDKPLLHPFQRQATATSISSRTDDLLTAFKLKARETTSRSLIHKPVSGTNNIKKCDQRLSEEATPKTVFTP